MREGFCGQHKKNKAVLLFVLPSLILYVGILIIPLFQSLTYSFYSWSGFGKQNFVGFSNYIKLITGDPAIKTALRNTLYLIVLSLIFMLPLAFLLANSLNSQMRSNRFFSTVFYMPCIISTVIIATMWAAILDGDIGPINAILTAVGLERFALVWLGDPKIAVFAVIFINTWQRTGYHMLIIIRT